MKNQMKHALRLSLMASALLGLAACSDNDDPVELPPAVITPPAPPEFVYQLTVTNLTSAQPISPIAIVLHESGHLWTIGEAASVALEQMAEGGDNSALLAASGGLVMASGAAPIGPGDSETVELTIVDKADALLSFAGMLVNTNDAFAGLDAWNLSNLSEAGMSWSTTLAALDAGTEANSEAPGTIPGPADGGMGYDPMRVGTSIISFHPGVVSADDGLSTSVLGAQHKFDNPTLKVTITRMQ